MPSKTKQSTPDKKVEDAKRAHARKASPTAAKSNTAKTDQFG